MESFTSCCFTGYRPAKFPFKFDRAIKQYVNFENSLNQNILKLISRGCYTFYSGMAMGFDIIAAENVLLAKKAYKKASIKLICAIPFIEQSSSYTPQWRERYEEVLTKCDEVVLTSDVYFKGCYAKRNEFMVDNSDFVITWFDGKNGGTKNTIDYANRLGRQVININCGNYLSSDISTTEFILD